MTATAARPSAAGWHTRRLATFDVETTGVDYETDRIVTASFALVGGGEPTSTVGWLVDPGVEIPEGAAAVHGVTTARARAEGRPPAEAIAEMVEGLTTAAGDGVPLIAFNARFDLTMLDREARRHGIVPLVDRVDALRVVDPFVLDKQVDRFRKGKRTLGVLCELYGVQLGDDAHDADADALAAARLAWRMATRFPEIGGVELAELHAAQVAWAAEQAASLEAYFRRKGRAERCERAWPIAPFGGVS